MNYHTYIVILLSLLSFVGLHAEKKTICLNMIVKNESRVITRCLSSVLPIIDYWVIVDTGSDDNTQQIIKEFMKEKDVPGELHERPWKNFGHNRNEALQLAKGKADFVFFIDADEYLMYEPGFHLPPLDKDYYYMTLKCGGSKWGKIQLINNHINWQWVGILHEAIYVPPGCTGGGTLDKVVNIYTSDGARSRDPKKYQKDAEILEAALKDNPNDSRTVFYLAESYTHAGNLALGLENYEKRTQMGGWDEEIFISFIKMGQLHERLKSPPETVINCYQQACEARRTRAEPYYHIAHYYFSRGEYEKGYKVASICPSPPLPTHDVLFVEEWVYDYGLLLELSICAYWMGLYEESQKASLALLQKQNLPDHVRECVQNNLGFANQRLLEELLLESSSGADLTHKSKTSES